MYLFDTNVLSELVLPRPNLAVINRLELLDRDDCFSSEVTFFELRFGAMLRRDAESFWQNLAEQIVPAVIWLPLTREIHMRAADLSASLEKEGRRIGNEDCWIAATAIEHHLTLVSRNEAHFSRITGLRVENWFDG